MSSAAPAAPPDSRARAGRPVEPLRLDPDHLQVLFAELGIANAIVAAVSGGPDSTVLMHALARWAAGPQRPRVIIATVDHGLQAASASEAERVAAAAARLGLPHHTLAWAGPKPTTGVQEAARKARYHLLAKLAHEQRATHLVTAHTLDDQAETVLMRLSRGSGIAGLAGMRRRVETAGLVHLRPFLHLEKAALVATCRCNGWVFHDDPANTDARFARGRWRKLLPLLAAEGLDAACLGRLAARAQQAEAALADAAGTAFEFLALASAGGTVRLDGRAFASQPTEIAVRVLAAALQKPGRGNVGHLRLERVESCARALQEAARAGSKLRRTLAGCVVALDGSGEIRIAPEGPRRRGRPAGVNHADAALPSSLGKAGGHT